MESWRKIADYDYEVSDWGNVRRVGSAKNLKPGKSKDRYIVNLCKEGTVKNCKIHRLVAIAFLENPDNLPEIDHIDRNSQNNKLENLRWCSRSQNCCNIILKNKTGFPGVIKTTSEKFMGQITINGKRTYLGSFDTPEEAYEAYKKKKNEIAGGFSPFV
jgi:hypothetical protein